MSSAGIPLHQSPFLVRASLAKVRLPPLESGDDVGPRSSFSRSSIHSFGPSKFSSLHPFQSLLLVRCPLAPSATLSFGGGVGGLGRSPYFLACSGIAPAARPPRLANVFRCDQNFERLPRPGAPLFFSFCVSLLSGLVPGSSPLAARLRCRSGRRLPSNNIVPNFNFPWCRLCVLGPGSSPLAARPRFRSGRRLPSSSVVPNSNSPWCRHCVFYLCFQFWDAPLVKLLCARGG